MKEKTTNTVPNAINIRLFGTFEAAVDTIQLPKLRSKKDSYLLALLCLSGGNPLSRRWLTESLWPYPDYADDLVGQYLRRSLMNLRKALGKYSDIITTPTSGHLAIDLSIVDCDVIAFDSLMQSSELESIQKACEIYLGPLLAGAEEYWLTHERQRREKAFINAITLLAEFALEKGDHLVCREHVRNGIGKSSISEPLYRILLRSYGDEGEIAAITDTYQNLRRRLRNEFNCEPSLETTDLYMRLRRTNVAYRAHAASNVIEPASSIDQFVSTPSRIKLPRKIGRLIGRENEVQSVIAGLRDYRQATIVGPGGIGKTSVAIEVGSQLAKNDNKSVFFIDLRNVLNPELINQRIARSLEMPFDSDSDISNIATFIENTNHLLIFDSCEHLLELSAKTVEYLVSKCPDVNIIATSRETLHISNEYVLRLKGLKLRDRIDKTAESPAMHLFIESAVNANPGLSLSQPNYDAISQICTQLDGIPLSIEIAANALRAFHVSELASRLHEYILVADYRESISSSNTSEKISTLKSVFEWSFNLLSKPTQDLLVKLSIFPGRFNIDSVREVCGDTSGLLSTLIELIDKSLIVFEETGYEVSGYRILSTIRHYLLEHLDAANIANHLNETIISWVAGLAESSSSDMLLSDQSSRVKNIDKNIDSIRSVMDMILAKKDMQIGVKLAANLTWYWEHKGLCHEGYQYLSTLVNQSHLDLDNKLKLRAELSLGNLSRLMGKYPQAKVHVETAMKEACRFKDVRLETEALIALGDIENNIGNYELAKSHLLHALDISSSPEENLSILKHLGFSCRETGEIEQSRRYLIQAMDIANQSGDDFQKAQCMGNLYLFVQLDNGEDAAFDMLAQTIPLYENTGSLPEIAWTLAMMGHMRMLMGQLDDANYLIEQALEINIEIHHSAGLGWNFRILGEILYLKKLYIDAEISLQRAQSIDHSIGSSVGEAWALFQLGRVAKARKNIPFARDCFEQAYSLILQSGRKQGAEAIEDELNSFNDRSEL